MIYLETRSIVPILADYVDKSENETFFELKSKEDLIEIPKNDSSLKKAYIDISQGFTDNENDDFEYICDRERILEVLKN